MTDIEQVRAALDAIDVLIDLIDCTDKHNLSLLPLFLDAQKGARAALPLIRAAALEEAAKELEDYEVSWSQPAAAAIRYLKEQP